MRWDDMPSRVMDVYKHLHARCGATSLPPGVPVFSFARHTSVVGALRTLKECLNARDPSARTSVEIQEIFDEVQNMPDVSNDV
eukprot:1964605-Amphidinium_carterae.1